MLFLQIASIIIVFPALLHGAYHDIKTRTAPKYIWDYIAILAGASTFLWYIYNFYWNGFNEILQPFLVSVILCLFCLIMAYRMGNGGDWRALFWVCLLVPWVAMETLLFAGILGIGQVGIDKLRGSPVKSAWMVSIALAYAGSVVLYFAGISIIKV